MCQGRPGMSSAPERVPYAELGLLSDWAELRGISVKKVSRWRELRDCIGFPKPEFSLGLGRYQVYWMPGLDAWWEDWKRKH
jgi:hypothetical protein